MSLDDKTNYNKANMEELAENIKGYKERYDNLVSQLENKVTEMHNYWVEDPGAETVYQNLLKQFNTFKSKMLEGYDQMTQFENQVLNQVSRYESAETQTNNSIG